MGTGEVIALGSNAHLFARPGRRQNLEGFFGDVLGAECATVQHPRISLPMLLVRFSGGGSISIEFRDDALDDDTPRLGAWLELRCDDPGAIVDAASKAGRPPVDHPGHDSHPARSRRAPAADLGIL
jgi:hypothetical protein